MVNDNTDTDITLNYSRDDIRRLFSHPANCHEVCFVDKSLEETIKLYLNMSLLRDGYKSEVLDVNFVGPRTVIKLSGQAAASYQTMLPKVLGIGEIGLKISRELPKALDFDDKGWRYNWRFFLPLGVAMVEHPSVQLLHFPPDSVLERDQDYLAASTTRQWARLLAENQPGGVAEGETPESIMRRTAAFQNIIDLAPIAAPSNDGKNIDKVYRNYEPYFIELMKLWVKPKDKVLPIVAFGSPVRSWVQDKYKEDLNRKPLAVLSAGRIQVAPGLAVPILGANHPSYIFNADEKYTDDPTTPVDERLVGLMLVLWEDLVAAYWQVEMSKNCAADPEEVLQDGIQTWSTPQKLDRLAVIVDQLKLANFVKNKDQFQPAVQTLKEVVRSPDKMAEYRKKLDQIQNAVGSLDSRSPRAIALNKTADL